MKKFLEILEGLEVFELAYLIKHRLNEFMPQTQNSIVFELLKRGYEKHEADSILEKKKREPISINSTYLICKNCGSTKFYTSEQSKENDYFTKLENKSISKKTTYTCWICNKRGQVIVSKEPSFFDRLLGKTKNYNKRVK